jgi:REP element-mobilizing transposase RayT
MSEVYKINNPDLPHFMTFSVLNWFPVFKNEEFIEVLINAIKFYQTNRELELYAYCIMPTHAHFIMRSETYHLAGIVRDLKRYVSFQITNRMELDHKYADWLSIMALEAQRLRRTSKYKFWQDGYHPIEISSGWFYRQKLAYIHANPVEDGLCAFAADYLYSSARNYAGIKSYLDISITTENGEII